MNCSEKIKHTTIVLQDGDGKCKMRFNNPQKKIITKVRVDNCVITEGRRCDFMLLDHNNIEYFIELKGKQVSYACLQIEETIMKISSDKKAYKHSFVISTACPLTTTEVQVLKALFKKKYNSSLTVKNNLCEYCIE